MSTCSLTTGRPGVRPEWRSAPAFRLAQSIGGRWPGDVFPLRTTQRRRWSRAMVRHRKSAAEDKSLFSGAISLHATGTYASGLPSAREKSALSSLWATQLTRLCSFILVAHVAAATGRHGSGACAPRKRGPCQATPREVCSRWRRFARHDLGGQRCRSRRLGADFPLPEPSR